ncbi:MAG: hypothetical protein ACKO5K_12145, partial [Armatimonadota bacterium]
MTPMFEPRPRHVAQPPAESLKDLLTRAVALKEAGKPAEAAPLFARILERAGDALPPVSRARLLITLGSCLAETGDADGALARYEEARPLVTAAGEQALEAMVLANIGGLKANSGDLSGARIAMEAALPLLEAGRSRADVAGCLVNLELVTYRMGDFRAALAYADRAIAVQETGGTADALARALGQAAALNANLGRSERALALSSQAMTAASSARNLRTRAEVLVNHATFLADTGKLDEALRRTREGLTLHRQAGDFEGEAFAQCTLSRLLRRRGPGAEAVEAANAALAWFEKVGNARGVYAARMQLGYLAVDVNDPATAVGHYRECLRRCEAICYVRGEAAALGAIADAIRASGKAADAEPWYAQAVAREDRLSEGLRELPDAALRYGERFAPLMRRYVGVLHEMGRVDDAFAWTQRAKARFLADAARQGNGIRRSDERAPDAERSALVARERALTARWLESAAPGGASQGTRATATLRDDRRRLDADWNAFEERRRLRGAARTPAGAGSRFGLEDAAALLPARTALIEYAMVSTLAGDAIVATVVVSGGGVGRRKSFTIPAARTKAVLKRVAELRAACSTKPGVGGGAPWRAAGAAVADALIAPAMPLLSGCVRWVVCPDGPLWDVPFAALP